MTPDAKSSDSPPDELNGASCMSDPVRRVLPLALIVYWGILFTATHIPDPDTILKPDISDKTIHFGAYFVLYGLMAANWISRRGTVLGFADQAWLISGGTLYAVVDELLQALPIIGRHCSFYDGLADCGGLCAAAVVVSLLQRRFLRWLESKSSV